MKICEVLQESVNPRDLDVLASQVNNLGIDIVFFIENVITKLKNNTENVSGETLFKLKMYADVFINDFEKSIKDLNDICNALSVNDDTISNINNDLEKTSKRIKFLRQELDK